MTCFKTLSRFSMFFILLHLVSTQSANAFVMDLLGDISKPLLGSAKDKASGVMKYLWLQPYVGYSLGSGTLKKTGTAAAQNFTSDISYEGVHFGGRGGFLLGGTFKLGVDYTKQLGKKTESALGTGGALASQQSSAIASMFGAIVGFDVPYTPVQGFVTRYFSANLAAEKGTSGDGWGGGISFTLINPFILITEYRQLNFTSELSASNDQTFRSMKQFYFSLSFLLL